MRGSDGGCQHLLMSFWDVSFCGVHPSVVPEERTGGVPDLRNRGPHLRELVLLARARATARLAFLFARRAVEINLIGS